MNPLVFNLLMGVPQGGEGAAGGAGIMTFLPFVAIIAIFYFLIIRPQSRKQKETQKMLSALKKGDRIVTIGGMHGVIQNVRDHTVIVKVDESVKLEFNRSAISSITVAARDDKADKEDAQDNEASGEKS
jgi:preprotein translocase subunit YajC